MILSFCFSFIFLRRIYLYFVGAYYIYKNANGIEFNRIDSRGFSTCLMCNPKRGGGALWCSTGDTKLLYWWWNTKYQSSAFACPLPSILMNLCFPFGFFLHLSRIWIVWSVTCVLMFEQPPPPPSPLRLHVLCEFYAWRSSIFDDPIPIPASSWEKPEKQKRNEFRKREKKKKRNWIFPLFVRNAFALGWWRRAQGAIACRLPEIKTRWWWWRRTRIFIKFIFPLIIRSAFGNLYICFHSIGSGNKSIRVHTFRNEYSVFNPNPISLSPWRD